MSLDPLPIWALPAHGDDPDADGAVDAFWARQATLTKPPRSLGRLEDLGAQLAWLQGTALPVARPAACVLFASDHPVAARGVSAYPVEVTRAMVANFAAGGAASSVMCRQLGLEQHVIDVGVQVGTPGIVRAACAELPVGDLVTTDAMPRATYLAALRAGADAIAALGPVRIVALGEMGIGNSTCAAAVGAAILGRPARELVGPGTGVAGDALAGKLGAVRAALARIGAAPGAPIDGHRAVEAVGGRDIAALVGAMAAAAERRIAILVDGFIATAAALALCAIAPAARRAMIFAHRSREPGHAHMLAHLDARPLLELELALGEATGALAALPLCDLACAITAHMATFAGAGVPDRA